MESDQLLEMIKELLTERLEPIMERLQKLEGMTQKEGAKEETIERDAAEARDDERKEEDLTEAAEPMTVIVEDEKVGEVVDAIAEAVEGEEEEEVSESEMKYAKLMEDYKKLADQMKEMKEASKMKEQTIEELKKEAILKEAQAKVSATLADKPHLSQMSERLVDLYINDQELFNDIVSIKGGGMSSLSERTTRGLSPVAPTAKKDVYEMAYEIQNREGISYAEALAKLTK